MKNIFDKSKLLALMSACAVGACAANAQTIVETDSVDVLAYAPINADGGMRLAWRAANSNEWQPIGDYTFVSSDFGPWGSHKKMFSPVLSRTADGWQLVWIADPEGYVVATAVSPDLVYWKPQTYAMGSGQFVGASPYLVAGKAVSGSQARMSKAEIEALMGYVAARQEQAALYDETMAGDGERFSNLKPLSYTLKPEVKKRKPITDMLIGIFFEDINYAADGGLYAELVQNRDFEYQPSDRGNDQGWNSLKAWRINGGDMQIKTADPLHANNPHYLAVKGTRGDSFANNGFDGIPVKGGEKYDLSFFARGKYDFKAQIVNAQGKVEGELAFKGDSKNWEKHEDVFVAAKTDGDCKLRFELAGDCQFDIDLVSLFPQNTFKGRRNGLRADLAQALADLHPRFVRFPGGCVAHGDGIDNIYDWKGSIGPLEARKPLRNLWGYHQTRGLGYYEYFQFCEDIGAEPLPVLSAGVPCQNSGSAAHHSHDALTTRGQQCGIPMEEMPAYIQDVLDLIEWANGPADSQWGAKRAEAGHPEPFNLKYIGIGNEDMITEVFEERFKMIYDAVREAYPEVKVVGTVGPFYEGTDYTEGWRLARELDIPYVDEHYYVSPGWLIYNQDYYDDYQRGGTEVYLGEWAAHLPGRPSNIETALAEALYLTAVERNGDVVAMTSYAPLFSKDGHTQWRPDLIYFNNTEVRPSVDYYVQQLYGQNSGDEYVPMASTLSTDDAKAAARVASSLVYDTQTGQYILKLANLLPVAVETQFDLTPLRLKRGVVADKTVIAGAPVDEDAVPVKTKFPLPKNGKLAETLPPYSFTVIRF